MDPRFKRASNTSNYWEFFQLAKDILGTATFNGIIRNTLSVDEEQVPSGYQKLFELSPRGVITLNLDSITGQAFSQSNHRSIVPVYGFEIARKWQIITDEKPYLVYMHGHLHDHETWVLTQSELDRLLSTDGHRLFLSQIYMNHTVLFVGLSADDIAISSALLKLKSAGFAPPRLFWLTTRIDSISEEWSKDNFVQKILYKASNDAEHEAFLNSFVDDIRKFYSKEQQRLPPQITTQKIFNESQNEIRDPRKIANLESEEVRRTLSDLIAKELHGLSGDSLYDAFDEFCRKYKYPIQTKSFYKDSAPPDNVFFGYKVIFPELGSGNFGEAFQATDEENNAVCIKIMHSNIVNNREMIGGFRRGVRSMKILTAYGISGVARIIEAFEIPPTIVMDIIPGNSLQELFSSSKDMSWKTKIEIINDISLIVDRCHKLPEMILHRDIKPSNIMIENFDFTTFEYEKIFVLDFDMSWHKNSSEKDIVFESRDDFGYLAPEQTDPARRVSTRSTKVDSYGLAMTAFALIGGIHPMAGWSMSADWETRVRSTIKTGFKANWSCLHHRVARAIIDASRVTQEDRLDFSSFSRRLEKAVYALQEPSSPQPIDLIAEEILSQISDGRGYQWDDVSDKGYLKIPGGTKIEIDVDSDQTHINIGVRYTDEGSNQYRSRKALLGETKEMMDKFAKKYASKTRRINITHGVLDYVIAIKPENTTGYIKELHEGIKEPIDKLIRIQ